MRALIAVAACLVAGQARSDITNWVTFTLTAYVQNTNSVNQDIVSTQPAVRRAAGNKDLLDYIAHAYWTGPFPTGSKLALVTTSPTNGYFAVFDSRNNLLVDVTDIMTFSTGANLVFSGKQNFYGDPSPTLKGMELVTINYDDRYWNDVGDHLVFTFTGFLSGTLTRGTTGTTLVATISNGTGEGYYQSIPLVLTGTMTLRGKGY